jgi:transcriptional regulator with GAF, ATPase, and Fis domain
MNEFHELEQRANDELEPKRKQKPDAGKQLPNGRWLHNVLPLDPSTKTSEHNSLSLGGDSDVDHDVVEPSLSPEQHLRQGHRLGEAKADFERRYLQAALAKCRGNLAAAARCSGMDRSNFRRLLKRYGLHPGSVERA